MKLWGGGNLVGGEFAGHLLRLVLQCLDVVAGGLAYLGFQGLQAGFELAVLAGGLGDHGRHPLALALLEVDNRGHR